MLVTTEWSQRSALVTFALEPRRAPGGGGEGSRRRAARRVATLVVSLVIGALAQARRAGCCRARPTGRSAGRDLAAFVVTQVLAMLGGFALATLLLNTSAPIVVFVALPVRAARRWSSLLRRADRLVRRPAARGSTSSPPRTTIYEWSSSGEDWAQLVVSGFVWLVLPLAFGLRRVLRAEVKWPRGRRL